MCGICPSKSSIKVMVEALKLSEDILEIDLCADHVISTGRRMTNLVLNVCFDFFSRHENQI